jgi:hypothetical protein
MLSGRRLRVIKVTPELAKMWLEASQVPNRNISWPIVAQYARLMKEGKWRPTGDPIRLTERGVLDGQKRLHAIIKAGVTIELVVLDNAEEADQDAYDSGQGRTAAQQIRMRGKFKNPNVVSSVCRAVLQWHTETLFSHAYRPHTLEIEEFAERWRTRVEASVEHAVAIGKTTKVSKALVGAFAFTAYDAAVTHPERVKVAQIDDFLEALATGANMSAENPVMVLRDQALRFDNLQKREPEGTQLYRIIATWKNWRRNRTYTKLQLPKGGEITYNHLKII